MNNHNAGTKISSQMLYQQQQNKPVASSPTIIAADLRGIENIGALYRLADAAACNKIIFIQQHKKTYDTNEKVTFVSRSTNRKIQTEYWTYAEFEKKYLSLQPLIALELTTRATNILNTTLPFNCSIVIGSETDGIDQTILNYCEQAVKVPMFGIQGSMNVTHALTVCLYEWHRQHSLDFS